jgi:hypothetical protein
MEDQHHHEHPIEAANTPAAMPLELVTLKEQILTELHKEKMPTGAVLQWNSLLVTIILAVVAIFSIAQAVQSAQILSKVKGGSFGAASAPAGNAQDLPNMVGGC